jgi:leucyl-tRNA synthetase
VAGKVRKRRLQGFQVNGKLRGTIKINKEESKEGAKHKLLADKTLAKFFEDCAIIKEIYVPGKVYNIVIKN